MDDEPQDSADERPKVFKNVNAWIGGITGVVIALAGLRLAWQQLMPTPPVQAATETQGEAPPNDASTENDAVEDATTAAQPLSYKAEDATFEKTGGLWVYTSGDEVTRYQEVSRDGGNTLVFDPMRKVYARWPTTGGMVKESKDDQKSWEDSFEVWLPEEADAPAAQ